MKKKVEVWILRNSVTGVPWTTPNNKASWGSKGAAKNAWHVHGRRGWAKGVGYGAPFDEADHNLIPECLLSVELEF